MWAAQETPDFRQVPVYDGVDTHEVGPVPVRAVEVRELGAVGVCAAGADKYCADAGVRAEVEVECIAEGDCFSDFACVFWSGWGDLSGRWIRC